MRARRSPGAGRARPTRRHRLRRLAVLSAGVMQVLVAGEARADIFSVLIPPIIPDDYRRDRNVSVLEEDHPDFDPVGIPLGAFAVNTQVTTTAGATSNVFENDANRHGDVYLSLFPYVRIGSDWSRHALALEADDELRRYAANPLRNSNSWYVHGTGRLDVADDFKITADGFAGRFYDSPYASDVTSNIEYLLNSLRTNGKLSAEYAPGRVRLTATVSYLTLAYAPVYLANLPPQPQAYRNQHIVAGAFRGEYALSPSVSAYAETQVDHTSYPEPLPGNVANRDSHGVRVLGGANFDVPGLIRGVIGVGYTRRSYKAGIYRQVSGFSYDAKVDVFVDALTTATVQAGRVLQDDINGSNVPYLDDRFALQIDHSFLENLIGSISAQHVVQRLTFPDVNRKLTTFGANATFRFNRALSVTAAINDSFSRPDSDLLGNPFSELYGSLAITLRR